MRNGGVGSSTNIARGLYENLEPYIAKSTVLKSSDLAPINDLFRWNGKQQGVGPRYGLVKDWSMDTTLWFNKNAFAAAGVKPVAENQSLGFDEMLAMAKKLTIKKSGQYVQYGLDIAWGWSMPYLWLGS